MRLKAMVRLLIGTSLGFFGGLSIIAAALGLASIARHLALLTCTSVVQHMDLELFERRPRLLWIDRTVASVLGIHYGVDAARSGIPVAAALAVLTLLVFVASRRYPYGSRRRIGLHAAMHAISAVALGWYIARKA